MKKLMLLFAIFSILGLQVYAQNTVTGKVIDDAGEALPGVSVLVKGTTIGTMTLGDGAYSIDVPDGSNTLVFSYIGMETQEVTITGNVVDVTLVQSSEFIDEVVVTALGVSKEKKALGYEVQSVSGEDIQQSNADDVTKLIGSRTSGVIVTESDGGAGSASYMTIRGAASLTRNNQPLYVIDGQPIASTGGSSGVDGVQMSARSIDINPEDIESISVLKGGAATALYGVQAANGVIMITTKKGKAGQKMEVNFSSSFSMNQVSKLPALQTTYGQGSDGQWISGKNTSWGPKLDTMAYSTDPSVWLYPEYDVHGALVSQNDPLADGGPAQVYDKYAFFQNGYTYNNNISLSNANDVSSYYISIGNRNEEGIVPNNVFNRTSIRVNSSTKLTDKITTGANINYVYSYGNFIQKGSNTSGIMLGLLRTAPSFDNAAGYELEDGSQRSYRHGGGYDNPYWVANKIYYHDKVNRLTGNIYADYDALDWLSFSLRVSNDFYLDSYKDVMAIGSNDTPTGSVYESGNYQSIFNTDFLAKINRNLTDDLNLSFNLGANMYRNYFKYVDGYTDGDLIIPGFDDVSNTSNQKTAVNLTEFRTMAVFGDLTLAYKNMLYVGGTVRNEWATTMPEDNLSSLFPSANLSFVFSELGALKGNNILSFGKLRASYAVTANYASAYNLSTPYVTSGAGDGWTDGLAFPLLGQTGFTLGDVLGSADLNHEKTKTIEVGAELKFMKNRIGLDVSYFDNQSVDLLMAVPVAPTSGYGYVYRNAGTMSSKGIEVSLYLNPVKTKDLNWDINVNFTQNKNVVESLAEGIDNLFLSGFTVPQIRAVAGEDYRSVYGNDWYKDADGNMIINDDPTDGYTDGFPFPADTAMVSLGTINPDWTANIFNSVSYKGITFSFLFDFKKGGLFYNGTRFAMNFFGVSKETENRDVVYNADGTINMALTPSENIVYFEGKLGHLDADGNVVVTGDAHVPVVLDQTWYQGYGSNFGGGPSAAAMEDASWIRLKEVSLSYKLNKTILDKTFLSNAEVFATGTNLWLSTPYTGIDPNTSLVGADNGQGMDYFNMPGKKSYTFGIRLTF